MEEGEEFVDYYDLLQVSPISDAKTLEGAYRHLAKLYHPDHSPEADIDKFSQLTRAYRTLRNPTKRSKYNRLYSEKTNKPTNQSVLDISSHADGEMAISDAEIHELLLKTLYKRRREHTDEPGLGNWLLQEITGCSDDVFGFHVWYLKSKGLIETTEQGTLAVTVEGVDHVISMSRTASAERLMLERSV
jgi:curved DNA-binding protein